MIDREKILELFPSISCRSPSLYDLASAIWGRSSADGLINVDSWTDLIDVDVRPFGNRGLGPLLGFMEADMATAFLPAWMVVSLENEYNHALFAPMLIDVVDPHVEGKERSKRCLEIGAMLGFDQRAALAAVLIEISDLHYQRYADARRRINRIANYWNEKS